MEPGTVADIIVLIHLLYVLFTVGGEISILMGGAIGWRWIRNRKFRLIHLFASFFVALEALAGIVCPLTTLEYLFRQKAGQTFDSEISFIGRLIHTVIYYDLPLSFFIILYLGFAGLVLSSYIFIKPTIKNKKT